VLRAGLAVAFVLVPAAGHGADTEVISQGREVDLEAHLVPGKLVLFDFFADWCMPCRIIEPHVDRLAESHVDSLAVRKVDVVDWESPVARQHRIHSLPHFVLYGPEGELLAAGDAQRVFSVLESRLGTGTALPTAASGRGSGMLAVAALVVAAVIGVGLLSRRRLDAGEPKTLRDSGKVDPGTESPPVWYAMVGDSLEGPFSVERLVELRKRREVDDDSRVRRKGEITWRRLADVLDSAG
jgi:thiol-disulfide isomerase/thioredoxin